MLKKHVLAIAAVGALNIGAAVWAQGNDAPLPPTPANYAEVVRARPPVTDQDITDRPYRILGEVRAEVRKATIFSRAPSRDKVFRELWERAERLRADAVINARAGGARVTGMSWGSRRSIGQAVKFLTDAEIAAGQTGERRPLTQDPEAPRD